MEINHILSHQLQMALNGKKESFSKEEYNKIPVHYCFNCLSLKIKNVPGLDDAAYCDDCGSTDIRETSIEEWDNLYKSKYGMSYLNNNY